MNPNLAQAGLGVIVTAVQLLFSGLEQRKQNLLSQLQQQYQYQLQVLQQGLSQAMQKESMDASYAQEYTQRKQQYQQQLFQGGAGTNPTQAGTDDLQKQAEINAAQAQQYDNLSKQQAKLIKFLKNEENEDNETYNMYVNELHHQSALELFGSFHSRGDFSGLSSMIQQFQANAKHTDNVLQQVQQIINTIDPSDEGSVIAAGNQLQQIANQEGEQ